MFKYFPTNYVWNLSVDLAIEMGARIGEIEEMCAPLQEAAKAPDAAGTQAFRETWVAHGRQAVRAGRRGRVARPAAVGRREAAPRVQLPDHRRAAAGARRAGPARAVRARTGALPRRRRACWATACERVEIPYEGKHLSALYLPAEGLRPGERAPLLVQVNGLDSTKEMKYLVGLPGVAGQARRVLAGRRPAGHRRGAAAARPDGALRQRTLGQPCRRLAGDARRRRPEAHRHGRRVARRLLLSARRGLRAALRLRRVLGRQPRLARRAEDAASRRKATSRCRTTGRMCGGCGARRTWTTSCASPRTCTWTAWSSASRCPSSSPTARRIRRFR